MIIPNTVEMDERRQNDEEKRDKKRNPHPTINLDNSNTEEKRRKNRGKNFHIVLSKTSPFLEFQRNFFVVQ